MKYSFLSFPSRQNPSGIVFEFLLLIAVNTDSLIKTFELTDTATFKYAEENSSNKFKGVLSFSY